MRRRGRELVTADEFDRRSRSCIPAGPSITGHVFCPSAWHDEPKRSVAFSLPDRYTEKSNLGMRDGRKVTPKATSVVPF